MALKLVITTRTEKQFDTLVTLGTHLKARLNWLVKTEDGTLILQSAKVKDYFWFLDSLRWFWKVKFFSLYDVYGVWIYKGKLRVSFKLYLCARHPSTTFIRNIQWEIFVMTAKWISTQFWTFTNNNNNNNNNNNTKLYS